MAIKDKFPAIRPSLNLDFTRGSVDPRISFTRASAATRFNSKGVLETVLAGVPRINYDPVTLECKGLLIEEQRANLLTYSEQFDNAAWNKFNSTVTSNATTAPDGTLTADKLVAGTTNTQHAVTLNSPVAISANTQHTLSVYVKSAEYGYVMVMLSTVSFSSGVSGFVNLATGAITNVANGGSASGATLTATPAANGWWRVSVSGIIDATSTSANYAIYSSISGSNSSYTGDGTSGIYIWGAQLEQGAFHTSYIPTTSAAVTRAADVAVMTGTNFSSWYRQDEGTLFAEAVVNGSKPDSVFVRVQNAGLTGYIQMRQNAGGAQVLAQVVSAGGSTPGLAQSNYVVGTPFKLALANKSADAAASFNGAAASTSNASTTVPVVDRLHLSDTGAYYLRRIAYYPAALPSYVQAITS